MKNTDNDALLAHKRAFDAQRKANAKAKQKAANLAAMQRIRNANKNGK